MFTDFKKKNQNCLLMSL